MGAFRRSPFMGSSAPRLGNPLPITFPSHFHKNLVKETPLDVRQSLALSPAASELLRVVARPCAGAAFRAGLVARTGAPIKGLGAEALIY